MPHGVYDPRVVSYSRDELFIIGGKTAEPDHARNYHSVWLFNIATEEFTVKSETNTFKTGGHCAMLYMKFKGKKVIFCVGNHVENKAEIYDIESDNWEWAPHYDMPVQVKVGFEFQRGNRLTFNTLF